MERIEALIAAFGLQDQTNYLIGTPIRKGISGGQKRRVSVASQLITSPKILFLDEVCATFSCYCLANIIQPTSGLDSQAAFEVMNFVKNIAISYKV
jgi:ABC-type multidrug transport system ATPase subunit